MRAGIDNLVPIACVPFGMRDKMRKKDVLAVSQYLLSFSCKVFRFLKHAK